MTVCHNLSTHLKGQGGFLGPDSGYLVFPMGNWVESNMEISRVVLPPLPPISRDPVIHNVEILSEE